jgi:hypothetical protein
MNHLLAAKQLLNANEGFLCISTYWCPNPLDKNPHLPGNKAVVKSYIPLQPDDPCLCGSGKRYAFCCQHQRMWHPICPNPGSIGFSLIKPQSVTYNSIDRAWLLRILTKDPSFYCVENSMSKCFWLYWGNPALEKDFGILCFGDIELQNNNTLIVRAMSDTRMGVLLDVLGRITQDRLGHAVIKYEKLDGYLIDKLMFQPSEKKAKRKSKNANRKRKR